MDRPDKKLILNDLIHPSPPEILPWWYSYQIGIALRFVKITSRVYKTFRRFEEWIERLYKSIVGGVQFVCSNILVGRILNRLDFTDWKRVAVTATNIIGWNADSGSMLFGLLPDPYKGLGAVSAIVMAMSYEVRAHLMMGLNVPGIFPPLKPKRNKN